MTTKQIDQITDLMIEAAKAVLQDADRRNAGYDGLEVERFRAHAKEELTNHQEGG